MIRCRTQPSGQWKGRMEKPVKGVNGPGLRNQSSAVKKPATYDGKLKETEDR